MDIQKNTEERVYGSTETTAGVPAEGSALKNSENREDEVKVGKIDIKKEEKTQECRNECVEQSLSSRIENTPKTFNEDRPKYILLEKTKALYTMLHPYLELFPKSEKFTLRQKIEESVLAGIRLIILQNYQQTDDARKKLILNFLSEIYILEVLLQEAVVFRYISYEGHSKLMPLVREINSFALARYKNLNNSQVAKQLLGDRK